ncbi:MAG: hypothetical protein IJ644_01725 [Oscillospiraceae bacterium]|nr:hypothetical protein [Oscillospiraceae bacterium]
MGISTIRTVFYILTVSVSGGLFLYTVVAGGLTWIKASNAGILQFHKIFHRMFYWCYYLIVIVSLVISVLNFTEAHSCRDVLEASQTVGIQAFIAYEEQNGEIEIPDENLYMSLKQQEYTEQMHRHQQNGFFYLFMAMLWFSMMMLNTGFVTQKGYYPMGSLKPRKLLAEAKEGELQFYLLPLKRGEGNKPLLKMKDTPENRSYFASLIQKRKGVNLS